MFCYDCLHLGQSIIQSGLLELHLQVVDSAHLKPRNEAPGVPLDCNRRLMDDPLNIRSLRSQRLNLALHHLRVLSELHLSPYLLLLELLEKLPLLVD